MLLPIYLLQLMASKRKNENQTELNKKKIKKQENCENVLNKLVVDVKKFYGPEIAKRLEEFKGPPHKNTTQCSNIVQTEIKFSQNIISRYKEIYKRFRKLKKNGNINSKTTFDLNSIFKEYKNLSDDNPLRMFWVNQDYLDVGKQLILLTVLYREIFCKRFVEAMSILEKSSSLTICINQGEEQNHICSHVTFETFKGIRLILLRICSMQSSDKITKNDSQAEDGNKNVFRSNENQIDDQKDISPQVPRMFYDKFILPNLFKPNPLLETMCSEIHEELSKKSAQGTLFLDYCLAEKPFLFIIFPAFLSLHDRCKRIWIESREAKLQILDLLAKLDMLLKITKHVYCQHHPGNYEKVIEFTIENDIYYPILDLLELTVSTIVYYHDYDVKPKEIFKMCTLEISCDFSANLYSLVAGTRINSLKIDTYPIEKSDKAGPSNQVEQLHIKTLNEKFLITYMLSFPVYPATEENSSHTKVEDTKVQGTIEEKISELRDTMKKNKNIGQILVIFDEYKNLKSKFKQDLKERNNGNYIKLNLYLMIALFQNDSDHDDFNFILKFLNENIKDIYTLKQEEWVMEKNQKAIKILLKNSIKWFHLVFMNTSIEDEPYEFLADVIEFFQTLLYDCSREINHAAAHGMIRRIVDFQHHIYMSLVNNNRFKVVIYKKATS